MSYAISATGDWLYNPVLLIYVFARTRSAGWVAAATMVRIIPEIILGPVAGALADRYPRKRVMVTCDAARAVLMLTLAAVALLGGPVAVVLALVFCAAAAGTPSLPAIGALTPALVDEDGLASANSLVSVVDYVALAFGPALGGVLVIFGTASWVFAINGATFVISAVLLSRIVASKHVVASENESLTGSIVTGVRAIRASGDAATLIALIPAICFIPGNSFVLFVLVSKEALGVGADGAPFVFAAVGMGGMAGSAVARWAGRSTRPGLVVGASAIWVGGSFAALAITRSAPVAYLLAVTMGAALIVAEVVITTLLQRVVSEQVLGRVFGIMGTLIYCAILVGSLFAALLVNRVGLGPTLAIAGSLPFIAVVIAGRRLLLVDRSAPRHLAAVGARINLLEGMPVFQGMSPPALETLARGVSERDVRADEVVIRQGDPADDFFIVRSGRFEVMTAPEGDGPPHLLDKLEEGDYFGEIGLLEKMPRTATVRAETDSSLYRIHGEIFLDAVSQGSAISGVLLGGVVRRLARSHPSARPAALT